MTAVVHAVVRRGWKGDRRRSFTCSMAASAGRGSPRSSAGPRLTNVVLDVSHRQAELRPSPRSPSRVRSRGPSSKRQPASRSPTCATSAAAHHVRGGPREDPRRRVADRYTGDLGHELLDPGSETRCCARDALKRATSPPADALRRGAARHPHRGGLHAGSPCAQSGVAVRDRARAWLAQLRQGRFVVWLRLLAVSWYDIETRIRQGLPRRDLAHRRSLAGAGLRGGRQVGKATSHGWSPILRRIALVAVPPRDAPRQPPRRRTRRVAVAGGAWRPNRDSSTWIASAPEICCHCIRIARDAASGLETVLQGLSSRQSDFLLPAVANLAHVHRVHVAFRLPMPSRAQRFECPTSGGACLPRSDLLLTATMGSTARPPATPSSLDPGGFRAVEVAQPSQEAPAPLLSMDDGAGPPVQIGDFQEAQQRSFEPRANPD